MRFRSKDGVEMIAIREDNGWYVEEFVEDEDGDGFWQHYTFVWAGPFN